MVPFQCRIVPDSPTAQTLLALGLRTEAAEIAHRAEVSLDGQGRHTLAVLARFDTFEGAHGAREGGVSEWRKHDVAVREAEAALRA